MREQIGFWLFQCTVLVGTVLAFWVLAPEWFGQEQSSAEPTVVGEVQAVQDGTYYQADASALDPHIIYDIVNQERMKRGLAPLAPHDALAELAEQRVVDMRTEGYYAHESPSTGLTFAELLRGEDYAYRLGCENLNLVFHADAEKTVRSWLASQDGHRECLLHPDVVYVGFAVSDFAVDNDKRASVVSAIHASSDLLRE